MIAKKQGIEQRTNDKLSFSHFALFHYYLFSATSTYNLKWDNYYHIPIKIFIIIYYVFNTNIILYEK